MGRSYLGFLRVSFLGDRLKRFGDSYAMFGSLERERRVKESSGEESREKESIRE